MLRSAAELYGQNFLWATDLSEQDHVANTGVLNKCITNSYGYNAVVSDEVESYTNGSELSDAQRLMQR